MPAATRPGAGVRKKIPAPAPTHVTPHSRRRVEIIGFTGTRNDATWGDDTVEKWPVNNLPLFLTDGQRFHRLFDLHDPAIVRADEPYMDWLRANTTVPVVMLDAHADIPCSVAFPKTELMAWCADRGLEPYFTNSISFLVALALMEGVDELGIYGVDMAQGGGGAGGEYAAQRPSCEFWLGVARGMGVRVDLPATSDLLKGAGLYGFEDLRPFARKLAARETELVERKTALEQQHAQAIGQAAEIEKAIYQLLGAIEDVKYIRGVWMMPEGTRGGADPAATTPPPSP